ncbi:MAG: protein kinase [Planctomycetota bacterium]
MKLSDLPARDLARLDAVCMDFEMQLRSGEPLTSDELAEQIESLVTRHGGDFAGVLRQELTAIGNEVWPSSVAGTPAETLAIVDDGGHQTSRIKSGTPGGHQATEVMPSLPALGQMLGPYRLTSILGRGGMGVVFKAVDTRLDRSVAIKMLAVDSSHAADVTARFQREAKAVAALSHPNIVELFDVGVMPVASTGSSDINGSPDTTAAMPYAVMEHLRGQTLQQRMTPTRIIADPISPETVRHWGRQLADALATAHANGVIHRDVKPENVMLMQPRLAATSSPTSATERSANSDWDHVIKLYDFGLSRVSGDDLVESDLGDRTEILEPNSDTTSAQGFDGDLNHHGGGGDSKTREGMIMGTPGYMSPEQARGEPITSAVDVFALGCILHEAFYGTPAFAGSTPAMRFAAVLEKPVQQDETRRRDDEALADLISRMLCKSPGQRPTADDILHELSRDSSASSDSFVASPALSTTHWSRRRLIELGVGGLVGGLLGSTLLPTVPATITSVRSIAVLSLQRVAEKSDGSPASKELTGPDGLLRGELLAGLLVNELSRIKSLSVPRYAPMTASRPDEFRAAAKKLEVDALITGTYAPAAGGSINEIDVNLQIISGKTGTVIAGLPIRTHVGNDLMAQTQLARDVAERIGQELTHTHEHTSAKDPSAFTCLVKGRTLADPGSESGLRKALMCFEHALTGQSDYAPALAGVALTSVTLAARTATEETRQLIQRARKTASDSLAIAPENPSALLAQAMLDYQTLGEIDSAREQLIKLTKQMPNDWQAHHQLGWIRMIENEDEAASRHFRLASQLHPMSIFLQTDAARAAWFSGRDASALQDALSLVGDGSIDNTTSDASATDTVIANASTRRYPVGLLIDMYEHQGDWADAAALDPELVWSTAQGRDAYFNARSERLGDLPYGPYGPTLNREIWHQRQLQWSSPERPSPEIVSTRLGQLRQTQTPLLGLMLARHPQLASLAASPAAEQWYPFLSLQPSVTELGSS